MSHGPPLRLDPDSRLFPDSLRAIDAPPETLWCVGRAELLELPLRVALVGTRAPTPYGEGQARRFAAELAERGIVVVSGLARGIDQAAHEAALDAGGATIAVLGSGVDRPWPRGPTTERIAAEGCLLSELPPGRGPRRHHFPLRNRLISGLAGVVCVIEAAHASGSLITARWAADQGRSVCAVPGRVDHPMARGCHRLIQEGARLVQSPADVLEELGLAPEPAVPQQGGAAGDPLLEALRGETKGADELARDLGSDLSLVLVRLVELELEGRVVRAPGGVYRLAERRG